MAWRPLDSYDRREVLVRAVEDARRDGACYLVLQLALLRLLAAIARFWQMHGGECERGEGCSLCHDVVPLEYLARHFNSMLDCECPAAAAGQVHGLEDAGLEGLEGVRLEHLVAGMKETVAEYEAELAELAEGAPEPDAVCEGGAR